MEAVLRLVRSAGNDKLPNVFVWRRFLVKWKKPASVAMALVLVIFFLLWSIIDTSSAPNSPSSRRQSSRRALAPLRTLPPFPANFSLVVNNLVPFATARLASNATMFKGKKLGKSVTKAVVGKTKHNARTFGCLRENCRGLEIEDLLDRGWSNHFRTAINNDTHEYRELNYHVTILLTDTTALNHMKSTRPDLYKRMAESYEGSSYIVAFENGDYIGGNKGLQLRVKDRFTKAFGCEYDTLSIQPAQYRLYVKSECDALLRAESTTKTWLLKPEAGSQGQGITFHSSVQEIMEKRAEFFPCQQRHGQAATERYLVQEYIQKPLLLQKTKFDARVYLFISSSDPYLVWFHRGYLRRALTPYNPTSRDRKAYLTNTHFQSSRALFNMSDHIWTFERLQDQVQSEKKAGPRWIDVVLEPNIKEVARFVFESARSQLVPRRGTSQIVGLDFMLDEQLALHFIEANGYPGFTWSINFDSRTMVEEMWDVMMESAEAPSLFRSMIRGDRYGGFSLIHSDATTEEARMYDPCRAMGDNTMITTWAKPASSLLIGSQTTSASASDGEAGGQSKPQLQQTWVNFIGGDKGASLARRHLGCDYEVKSARLFVAEECSSFLSSSWTGAVVLKHAFGSGKSDGVVLFPSLAELAKAWGACKDSTEGDWIASHYVESGLTLRVKSVAYPSGSKPLEGFSKEIQHSASDWDPPPTPEGVDDPVENNAKSVLQVFAPFERVSLSLRSFLLVASSRQPLVALSLLGVARTVRRYRCGDGSDTWDTLVAGEHVLAMTELSRILALESLAPQQYVSAVLEPSTRRVAREIIANTRDAMEKEARSSALFALDFVVDKSLRPVLVGVSRLGNDYSGPLAKDLQEARNQVWRIAVVSPAYLARARFGDAFGSLRFVWNDVEEARFGSGFSPPCFRMPAPEDFSLAVTLENYAQKKHAARRRDLKKRVAKKWDICRRRKANTEKCMGATLQGLYRAAVKREGLVAGDEKAWVSNAISELEGMPMGGSGSGRGGEVD